MTRLLTHVPILTSLLMMGAVPAVAGENTDAALMDSLVFHAPFDISGDAVLSPGEKRIFAAESLQRKTLTPGLRPGVTIVTGEGRYGGCLRFDSRSDQVICFDGTSVPYSSEDWSGTVSFWMRQTPDTDLPAGYCDPLQITQKGWNDGAFFVDFDKDLPRDFRLGVFSDYRHWNPDDVAWEKWPVENRPMVTVKRPPFQKTQWTHVAFTFDHINAKSGKSSATLYLNGKAQGTLDKSLRFSWDHSKVAMMLGIEYVGDLDDLMIFNRALTADEVLHLSQASEPLNTQSSPRN